MRSLLIAVALTVAPALAGIPPQDAAAQAPDQDQDLRVGAVEVVGIEELEPPVRLPRRLPLRPGGPYTTERAEATEQLIRLAVAESGHPYAQIEVSATVDAATGRADLLFEVDPGPGAVFGAIDIQAPPPFRERDIRERVAFEPGERFRPSAMERTRQAILALPGVEDAAVELPGLDHGELVLRAIVRVARPDRMADVGARATLSSSECLEVAGAWRHRHFLGGPRLFTITGGFTNLFAGVLEGSFPCAGAGEDVYAQPNYFLTTELFQPVAADPPTAVQARAFFRRRTAPQAYLLHGFGLHTALFRNLDPATQVRLAYLPERNEIRAAGHYFCINFGACDDDAIAALSGPRWLAPLEAGLQWIPPAARDPFGPAWVREAGLWPGALGPVWRPMARADVSGAAGPTGSAFQYLRGELEAAVARVLSPRTEAAVRLRLGATTAGDDAIPPQVRFYSGGPATLRGARQNLMDPLVLVATEEAAREAGCAPAPGGCPADARPDPDRVSIRPQGALAVVEANLEGRLWLTRTFQLAAFADAGALLGGSGPTDPDGARVAGRWHGIAAPGVGFRWLTALGPIRIDVGYDPRGPRPVPMLLQDPELEGLAILGDVVFDPYAHDDPGPWRELWRRLRLHFALGQVF